MKKSKLKPWEVVGDDGLPLQTSIEFEFPSKQQRCARTIEGAFRQYIWFVYNHVKGIIKSAYKYDLLNEQMTDTYQDKEQIRRAALIYKRAHEISLEALDESISFKTLMSEVFNVKSKEDMPSLGVCGTKLEDKLLTDMYEYKNTKLYAYSINHYISNLLLCYTRKGWKKCISVKFNGQYCYYHVCDIVNMLVIRERANRNSPVTITYRPEDETLRKLEAYFRCSVIELPRSSELIHGIKAAKEYGDSYDTHGINMYKDATDLYAWYQKGTQLRDKWEPVKEFNVYIGHFHDYINKENMEKGMMEPFKHYGVGSSTNVIDFFHKSKVNIYKLVSGGVTIELNGSKIKNTATFVSALEEARTKNYTLSTLQKMFDEDCATIPRNSNFIPEEADVAKSKYKMAARNIASILPKCTEYSSRIAICDVIEDEVIDMMSGRAMKDALTKGV